MLCLRCEIRPVVHALDASTLRERNRGPINAILLIFCVSVDQMVVGAPESTPDPGSDCQHLTRLCRHSQRCTRKLEQLASPRYVPRHILLGHTA